jgi:hypothetical protein
MAVMLVALLHLKSACQPHSAPKELTDLRSLVALLRHWEAESVHDAIKCALNLQVPHRVRNSQPAPATWWCPAGRAPLRE